MKQHIKLYEEFTTQHEMLTDDADIQVWLEDMGIEYYTINDDLTVDVLRYPEHNNNGDVNLWRGGIKNIPFQFGRVTGDFDVNFNHLENAVGFPHTVDGAIYAIDNELKTLRGIGEFSRLHVDNNKIRTLLFVPTPNNDIYFSNNPCTEIYNELGVTWEGHAKSILVWFTEEPRECLEFTDMLKKEYPNTYKKLVETNPRVESLLYNNEELKDTMIKVSDIEKGYF